MTKKWIAINLLLLAVAALVGWQLRASILRFKAENDLAKIQPVRDMKQQIAQEQPAPRKAPPKNYNPAEFEVIPEKNLFSDTRAKEEKVENAAPPETPPLSQKPILVGVIISDTERKASIIDPAAPQDRNGRRAQSRKIGDVYHGYTITEISPDRIVLESGTRREIIPLHEGSKRGQPGKTSILSTRVVSFGAGGTSGGTPVRTSVSAAQNVPAKTVVAPVASPAPTATGQQQNIFIQPSASSTRASAAEQAPAQQAPAQQQGSGAEAPPGTRIIRTPFGNIVRPIRR